MSRAEQLIEQMTTRTEGTNSDLEAMRNARKKRTGLAKKAERILGDMLKATNDAIDAAQRSSLDKGYAQEVRRSGKIEQMISDVRDFI